MRISKTTFALCLPALLWSFGCENRPKPEAAETTTEPTGPGGQTATDSSRAPQNSGNRDGTGYLTQVASFVEPQLVGVAVSKTGRIFANFPRWSNNPVASVAEVLPGGELKPYPDPSWNTWNDSVKAAPLKHLICVQSVYIDSDDFLWILDPASPGLESTVPGGPKLLKVDLSTNRVVQTIAFDASIAPRKSYLNDVRVNTREGYAYLTESGLGSLVVVNLKTGKSRKVLANHASTKDEKGLLVKVEGRVPRDLKGLPVNFRADGIALDSKNEWVYYRAIAARNLYRIPTKALQDESLSEADLAKTVQNLGQAPITDGMIMDTNDNLYFTAIEENAVIRRTPSGGMETLVKDDRLKWPDSFSIGPDNQLYVTTSQIHLMPRYNQGISTRRIPFMILKMPLTQ